MAVSFYLNGSLVTLDEPDPGLLLIDFLRSASTNLKGAKKGCGQGGCGACTVILSEWDAAQNRAHHRSINSCLRPVCSLNGLSVTTVEGTGGAKRLPPLHAVQSLTASRAGAIFGTGATPELCTTHEHARTLRARAADRAAQRTDTGDVDVVASADIDPDVNPVAYRLAVNNGSQCGYCSTGFVMNMSAFLANNPNPTKKEVEQAFDGNLCRCTGYRPILTAMKTFAVDWSAADEANRMPINPDDQLAEQRVGDSVTIPFAEGAKAAPQPANVVGREQRWLMPRTVSELVEIYQRHEHGDIYMLHANTAFGVYRDDFLQQKVLVDIRLIEDMYGIRHDGSTLTVGAGETYTALLDYLTGLAPGPLTSLHAALYMIRRTAGTVVRNAATIGGNTMLVLKHIDRGSGEPFPSDLFTVLAALDAKIHFTDVTTAQAQAMTATELIAACQADQSYAGRLLLRSYDIPITAQDTMVRAHKVALRDINAHSIVNATTILSVDQDLTVTRANLTFGGIAPFPWRAANTEAAMTGQALALERFDALADTLAAEIRSTQDRWADRMAEVGYDGFTSAYRIELAKAYLYKAIISALMQKAPDRVPGRIRSAADETWGTWPVSEGKQHYRPRPGASLAPVSEPGARRSRHPA